MVRRYMRRHHSVLPDHKEYFIMLTRTDCERDNVGVLCKNATTMGFGLRHCKRGNWVEYEVDDHRHVGRAIGRVRCEGKEYIELAVATLAFSAAFIRWIDPLTVKEVRKSPPRNVFKFFADTEWQPAAVFAALEYGVSDLHDQYEGLNHVVMAK
jgi:hypothetical protein